VHEIRADGAFGELEVRIVNEPLADNPRSSALAAGSVAAALARRGATFAII
jgi:aspartate dehydrogenase